jgi:short-subunit dehydrogenase
VNYFGAVNLTKAVLPLMKEAHHGKIIYMSSGVAIMGFQNLSAYAGSKNAIESLAKCLNIECANTGIHFHIMHPPLTHTDSSSALPIPEEMMKHAEDVGHSLANHIDKKSFIICCGFFEKIQIKLIYRFSTFFGRLFSKLTYDTSKSADSP